MNFAEQSTDFCIKYFSYLRRISSKLNLTPSQSMCLSTIPANGISQSDLAKKLSLDLSTLSRNADKLIKMGLIKRDSSSYDKRISVISLTDKGFSKYSELNELLESELNVAFDKFDMDEQNKILEFFNQIIWNFELIEK